MQLNERQSLLLGFVKICHGEQKRKYVPEPYWFHPVAVATLVDQYVKDFGAIEIALLHDVLEDTDKTMSDLTLKLLELGYTQEETFKILNGVHDLTEEYSSQRYPHYNRLERKRLEAMRLSRLSYIAQSVKYCDFIENIKDIVKHDPKFAKIYLTEKVNMVDRMRQGNIDLLILTCATLHESNKALTEYGELK
jgi:(p)ppGpp synthase/HD superfamily hydrolase